jgi:hypothetical protein
MLGSRGQPVIDLQAETFGAKRNAAVLSKKNYTFRFKRLKLNLFKKCNVLISNIFSLFNSHMYISSGER